MSDAEAGHLARRAFGLEAEAAPLDAERDQNFRLAGASGAYLLKISNPADDPEVLEMQNEAMLHIGKVAPDLPVMQPLPARDGNHLARVDGFLLRLFTFLPGTMRQASELDGDARAAFGAAVARMGLALRGFFHRAGGYEILWDLKQSSKLRPLVEEIDAPDRRAVVERVLDRFDANVSVRLPRLRAQVIHNDLTLDNVLLDDAGRVAGIVDFGDVTHTTLVCDLAVAATSLMWGLDDPIEAVVDVLCGYESVARLEPDEVDVLGDLIAARLAASVTIANWRVRRYPENAEYITAWEPLTWPLLERFDADDGWSRFGEALKEARVTPRPRRRPEQDELLTRRADVLGPALSPLSYDDPLYLFRGEGAWMFDTEGTRYLDAYNNVPVVGHCHPRVVDAICEQSALLNTNTRYLHDGVVELAERLVGTMPPGLDTVMFYNSGSEANDIAWRLATTFTNSEGAIVTQHAYHGVTVGTIALSPEEWTEPEGPEHVVTIAPPNDYRASTPEFERGVDEALATLSARGLSPAAFYLDPLFTSDGIFTPDPAHLARAVAAVRAAGGLFLADEVQCGYGRTGTHMWSFERYGVVPDLVTLGKPMGNGYPVAAVILRREIAERFASTIDLFSTFGGNPVAARASLAVLDVIADEGMMLNAHDVGTVLRARLDSLKEVHDVVGDVRGAGLLLGVEIVRDGVSREPDPTRARDLMNAMRRRGVLVGTTGAHGNVLKIRPPLVISVSEAELVAGALDRCLREL